MRCCVPSPRGIFGGAMMIRRTAPLMAIMFALVCSFSLSAAQAAPCMEVVLTGTMGGPPMFNGLAGAGTLVRFGDDSNNCNTVKLQFDTGRGTNMRLSQVGIPVGQLNAIFFTHMHSDHVEGFADLMQLVWHYNLPGPKIDVVCSSDAVSVLGFTMSCAKFVGHVGNAFIESGEMVQRISEDKARRPGGPADWINLITFEPKDEARVVWTSGDVKVSAVRSTHIAGHASYRVDTPVGSVVIGGDAGNDVLQPPRPASTSNQVEALARGADILVHSTIHPILGPGQPGGLAPLVFYRQSTASDLGAMAKRIGAKHLMLTHLIPPIGATRKGPGYVAGGGLSEADYRKAVTDSGFAQNLVVGTDLASVRLPAK